MSELYRCRLCGKEYPYSEMSEEHYPAKSVGNDDVIAFDIVKLFESLYLKLAQYNLNPLTFLYVSLPNNFS